MNGKKKDLDLRDLQDSANWLTSQLGLQPVDIQAVANRVNMQENAEYCDGQEFVITATIQPPTIYPGGFQLWMCKKCAYQFTQHPISDELPPIPAYHPKPIPMRFTVSEEQLARLKARLNKGNVEEETHDDL